MGDQLVSSGWGSYSGSVPALITSENSYLQSSANTLQAFAIQQANSANQFIVQLGQTAASLAPPTIDPQFPTADAAPVISTPEPPTASTIIWSAPAIPDAFLGTLNVSDVIFPSFDAPPPVIIIPDAPENTNAVAPDAPEINLDYEMPTLTVDLPPAPSLLSINVAPFGGLNMPTFDATAPEINLVAPTIREYVPGAQYTSALLSATQESLRDRIVNGGTGLGQEAETAIWDRGREREYRGAADAIAGIEKMEALGFALPPGGYVDARIKIITETDAAARGHSREVMIESARLELDNVKHALTTAVTLEGELISYTNSVEQRVFESLRYATEAGIAIYNGLVEQYKARVEVYRAQATVYETLVRAETAKVDAYKTVVEAEQVKSQVNVSLVEMYKAKVQAALANVDVYKAQIEGIQAQASIEQTRVAIFGEEVKAYGVKVSAYSAGVEAYRARIGAESAKQDAYTAQVRAFSANVEAQGKVIDARVAAYRGQVDGFTARWDGYKSQVQGEASRVQSLASLEGAKAEIYKATVQGVTSANEVLTKQWQVALDQGERVAEIAVSTAKANAELYTTTRSLALDAAKVGAQVSAQLGASALSALNFSMSFNQSRSDARSGSYGKSDSASSSDSVSVSNSASTATNYNYSV